MRRPVSALAVLSAVAVLALTGGCGSWGEGQLARGRGAPATATATAPAPTPRTAHPTSPMAFGVDTVDWPNRLVGARAIFAALPESVDGDRKRAEFAADGGYAAYGDDERTTLMVEPAATLGELATVGPDLPSALAVFATSCDRSTLVGTAPVKGLSSATGDNDVWFSCESEDDADGSGGGFMVAWTSGTLGWVANAPDATAMKQLLSPLEAAAAARPADGPGSGPRIIRARAPYGIEDAFWPTGRRRATALLELLPVLDGTSPSVGMVEDGDLVTARYLAGDTVTLSRPGHGLDAEEMLAVSFGLVYDCAPRTFRGTAQGVEGTSPARPAAGATVRWFTCEVDGVEGDDDFSGYAVGWTGGGFGWLVVGTSTERAAALVGSLVAEAGQ